LSKILLKDDLRARLNGDILLSTAILNLKFDGKTMIDQSAEALVSFCIPKMGFCFIPWAQCYKTFSVCNLQIFVKKAKVFCPWQAFSA
jgi:hypothetical protein